MSTRPIVSIVGVVIVTVLALAFGSEIIDASQEAVNHQYADNFTALTVVASVIPTLYYVGVLGIAGAIGFISVRDVMGGHQ